MQAQQATVIPGEDSFSQALFQQQNSPSTSQSHLDHFSPLEIQEINARLADATPQEILAWAIQNVPQLYQTTAFGLTGLVSLDMINKLSPPGRHAVPLIFINTLYHFPETLALAQGASEKYGAEMHVYMPPAAQSVQQFEAIYGERLWEEDEDSYDFLVKVGFLSV
jgi:phosphoadenosine phosphosulfate reductase